MGGFFSALAEATAFCAIFGGPMGREGTQIVSATK